jgi:hypothetical protein
MENYTNKNGLPMKWVTTQPFHEGLYEFAYPHIGMECHNLELLASFYAADIADFHRPDYQMGVVHLPANHHRNPAVYRTQKQNALTMPTIACFQRLVGCRQIEIQIMEMAAEVSALVLVRYQASISNSSIKSVCYTAANNW